MDEWAYKAARDRNLSLNDRFRSVRREHGLFGATTCAIRWGIVRSYLHAMHRLTIEGREHIPGELPFVMVGNHASHLDALIAVSVLPVSLNHRVFPIAAGDTFFRFRSTAFLSSMFLNVLPMARDGSGGGSLLALRERLVSDGCGFLLFPEGTRTRTGKTGRFKAGIGMLVAGTNVPVVPYYLSGTFEAWPPSRRMPRPHPVSMRIGAPMTFSGVVNHRDGWRAVAEALHEAVCHLAT